MRWAVVVSSGEPETISNALRLCNKAVGRGEEVSLFMLGLGVDYEQLSNQDFDLKSRIEEFQEKGDFYV